MDKYLIKYNHNWTAEISGNLHKDKKIIILSLSSNDLDLNKLSHKIHMIQDLKESESVEILDINKLTFDEVIAGCKSFLGDELL